VSVGEKILDPFFLFAVLLALSQIEEMIDLIRKTVLAGVGAAVLTKEKVEESLNDLVAKGRISADEAKATAEKIAEDGKREFESVSSDVQKKVSDLLDQMGLGQKDKMAELEQRLLALEIEVQNLAQKEKTG